MQFKLDGNEKLIAVSNTQLPCKGICRVHPCGYERTAGPAEKAFMLLAKLNFLLNALLQSTHLYTGDTDYAACFSLPPLPSLMVYLMLVNVLQVVCSCLQCDSKPSAAEDCC